MSEVLKLLNDSIKLKNRKKSPRQKLQEAFLKEKSAKLFDIPQLDMTQKLDD